MHTTLDLTSDRVHAIGLERMADIRSQMQQLLDEAGFAGSPTDYLEQVKRDRSEEHTSELQSLMRISYAVFCLKKKNIGQVSETCFLYPLRSPYTRRPGCRG